MSLVDADFVMTAGRYGMLGNELNDAYCFPIHSGGACTVANPRHTHAISTDTVLLIDEEGDAWMPAWILAALPQRWRCDYCRMPNARERDCCQSCLAPRPEEK